MDVSTDLMLPDEAVEGARPVLIHSTDEVAGYADVERAVAPAGENVNVVLAQGARMQDWITG